jgi:hypothetical protein
MEIEVQKNMLSNFAICTGISQNDKAILLKAKYYLVKLSRVLYVNRTDSTRFRIKESQNAFPELQAKESVIGNYYEGIIRRLKDTIPHNQYLALCYTPDLREAEFKL